MQHNTTSNNHYNTSLVPGVNVLDVDNINMKRCISTLNRIEKHMVPEMTHNPFSERFMTYCKKAANGEYCRDFDIHVPTGVTYRDIDWCLVEADVLAALYEFSSPSEGKECVLPAKAYAEIELEVSKQAIFSYISTYPYIFLHTDTYGCMYIHTFSYIHTYIHTCYYISKG